MKSLSEKVAAQRKQKAKACLARAEAHGSGKWAEAYRQEAEFWRKGAKAARAGDLSPLHFKREE